MLKSIALPCSHLRYFKTYHVKGQSGENKTCGVKGQSAEMTSLKMSKLTSRGVNNLECMPLIPDLLDSSKYVVCFYFKEALLIPFNNTPDQNF